MSSMFGCAPMALDELQKTEESCACSVPCTRVTYEPALSYAQLSTFSVDRLVLRDAARKETVKKQYELAREMLQRTDPDIVASDNKVLSELQRSMATLSEVVDSTLSSPELSEVEAWIKSLELDVQVDCEYLTEEAEQIMETVENIEEPFDKYEGCVRDIALFLKGFDISSTKNEAEHQLIKCRDIDCKKNYKSPNGGSGGSKNSGGGGSGGGDDGGTGGDGNGSGPGGGDDGNAGYISDQLRKVPETCMTLISIVESILWLPRNYSTETAKLYDDSTVDRFGVEETLLCENALDKIQDVSFTNATLELTKLMRSMFADPFQPGLSDLAQDTAFMMSNTSVSAYEDFHAEAATHCTWMGKQYPKDTKTMVRDLEDSRRKFPALRSSYSKFRDDLSDINSVLREKLARAVGAVALYRLGNITKLRLAAILRSRLVATGIEDLLDFEMPLEDDGRNLEENLAELRKSLHNAYDSLFAWKPPLLNGQRIASLKFLATARNMSEEIEVLYANISQDYVGALHEIIDVTVTAIEQPIKAMNRNLLLRLVNGGKALHGYASELAEYEQKSKMKQDFFMQNFLQVDIFYRELTSEHVVQRPSFAASSLLGEVGGFLGLLLGASVLTFCELLDYTVMTCLARFRKKKLTSPSKQM